MKRIFPLLLVSIAFVLLWAAQTRYILRYDSDGDTFDRGDSIVWQSSTNTLQVRAYADGNVTTREFSVQDLVEDGHEWSGIIVYTVMVDTVVGDTTTIDSVFMTGQADTVYFIPEKFVGTHWLTMDTLEWYSDATPGSAINEKILTASHAGNYYHYVTDASRDSNDVRYAETFPHPIHRMKVLWGDTTFVDIKFFIEAY